MHKQNSKELSKVASHNLAQTIKQAFMINKNPLPWTKAITAGICSGLPPLIGLILGYFEYGLLAGIGSFTYLYVFNIPYAQRAKKLFFALLGMTISVGLGTLVAPMPIASAIVVGLVGTIATFIFGSLRITGPAAIFFILGFVMSTGMPLDPSLAPLRAGLVFMGGVLAWLLGMIGWLWHPYEPETIAVKKLYKALSNYVDSLGTDGSKEARQTLVKALKSAEGILLAGHLSWVNSAQYQRLLHLHDQANTIYMNVLENMEEENAELPAEIAASIHELSKSIESKNKLQNRLEHAQAITISKPSLKTVFGRSLDKDSIVLVTAIRYGVIITFAAIVAYSFDFNRSYWITLSCAAVMSGATILSTFHRAIQRSLGTVIGILAATLILSFRPEGIVIVIMIVILTFLTELAIVLNYGIATLFITPSALLLAESTSPMHIPAFFASARVVDVLIGSAIGLFGVLMLGKGQASRMLPRLSARTIRSQQQFLMLLFSEQRRSDDLSLKEALERTNMQTNLTNLNLVFTTALGEIPSNKVKLELYRPVLFSITQLGYLLESCKKYDYRPVLSDNSLAQLLFVFETMALAAGQKRPLTLKQVPEIPDFSKLSKEIIDLQEALQAMLATNTTLKTRSSER